MKIAASSCFCAGLHLVHDEDEVLFVAEGADGLHIFRVEGHDAALALHQLQHDGTGVTVHHLGQSADVARLDILEALVEGTEVVVEHALSGGGQGGDGAAVELEDYKKLLLELNNQVVAQAPEDLVINTHVCRGNYHSTFFSSGAYDSVADLLFGEENVNAYYLEYDDKRSGGFAPLAKVSGDKKVVLGLITTKTPELEDKEKVIARIHEAAKYVPLDRLYLSPQCGFASCEIGNS